MSDERREMLETGDGPVEIIAGELLGDLRIQAGSEARIEAVAAKAESLSLSKDEDGVVRLDCRGDLKLRVPAETRLTLSAVRGDLRIEGIMGGIGIETVSGDLGLRGTGPADVGEVYGDLRAGQPQGALSVSRVYGDAIVRNAVADIKLENVGADLSVRGLAAGLDAKVGADARLDLRSGAKVDCRLTAGADIGVRLPADLDLAIEARSGANDFDVQMSDAVGTEPQREEGVLRMTLGEGGGTLHLEAAGQVGLKIGDLPSEGFDARWVDMGEEFRSLANEYSKRIEVQMSTMSETLSERLAHLSETLPEVLAAAGLSDGEAERIVVKLRHAGERAGERAQKKVERVMRKAERQAAGSERKASAAGRKARGHRRRRWVHMAEQPGTASVREPVSAEERMAVLRMLEAGRVSADEAERLLAAMEGRGGEA